MGKFGMAAYYNERDPYAAQWLRNLIAAGHIAPGDVDTRSIEDVRPDDLRGYVQCHFFAGIGVWSHALRLAEWPDTRPLWTGSCPCQPFSVAGAGRGVRDERHLWPSWFWLLEQCRPAVVFGEQVEAAAKHGWLDLVCADLEGIGYAVGTVGIPAAGVGAPHIRQRLWFVGHANDSGGRGDAGAVPRTQSEARRSMWRVVDGAESASAVGELADSSSTGLEGRDERAMGLEREALERGGGAGALADDDKGRRGEPRGAGLRRSEVHDADGRGTAVRGFWSDADWIPCRDGKARPVEPGTFPLAHGAAFKLGSGSALEGKSRVGMLRAYGNAVVAPVAAEFIRAFMEVALVTAP